jgi:hypothetical protein
MAAEMLACFLWHNTAAAVPQPLRSHLRTAVDVYLQRNFDPNGFRWTWFEKPRGALTNSVVLDPAYGLSWMLATDPVFEGAMSAPELPEEALSRVKADLISKVISKVISKAASLPLMSRSGCM